MFKIKVPTPKVRGQNRVSAITQKLQKQRTRVDKRVFWPQYFRKIEYVCFIGFRLT